MADDMPNTLRNYHRDQNLPSLQQMERKNMEISSMTEHSDVVNHNHNHNGHRVDADSEIEYAREDFNNYIARKRKRMGDVYINSDERDQAALNILNGPNFSKVTNFNGIISENVYKNTIKLWKSHKKAIYLFIFNKLEFYN